jgi:large subunit ribosomal protein L34e
MVRPSLRSRSLRRVQVRVPGGNTVRRYERRAPGKAQCAICGAVLKGVPRAHPLEMKKIPKSSRRPERPYGGVLCSACQRRVMLDQIRAEEQ